MRRILAGIVSGAVGLAIWGASSLYLGPSQAGLLAAGAATLGTYAFIDWLGLLPPPFEPDVRSLLHGGGSEERREREN